MFVKSEVWIILTIGFALVFMGCGSHAETNAPITFRAMSYNIHHGEGTDGKIDLERIAAVIKREKADIVGLNEIDRGVARTNRRDLIKELSKLTGMEFYFERNIIYQGGDYGNAILTRFPIIEKKNTFYKMIRPNEQRAILQTVLDVKGKKVVFMNTHIDYRPEDDERELNVREMKTIVAPYAQTPLIVVGDFNAEPESRVHNNVKTFLDDVWEVAGKGNGFTFPSDALEKRIDYIWMGKNGLLKPLKIWVPQTTASDHLPVMAEFEIR